MAPRTLGLRINHSDFHAFPHLQRQLQWLTPTGEHQNHAWVGCYFIVDFNGSLF